jgi:hypothetical protein
LVISHGIEIFFEPHPLLRITGRNFQIIGKKARDISMCHGCGMFVAATYQPEKP